MKPSLDGRRASLILEIRPKAAGVGSAGLLVREEILNNDSLLQQFDALPAGPLHDGSLMSDPGGLRQDVKPTSGYIISLALASTGIVFLGIGLGGNLLARNGGDPMDALGTDAIVTMVFAFSLGYALRLIFWRHSPSRLRNAVRATITTILILCLGVTAASLVLAWRLPNETHHLFIARWFSVYAAISQISSIIWIVRYRNEGLR